MNLPNVSSRERVKLVSTNQMRISGLQGVYGDPCGMELVPVPLDKVLGWNEEPLVLLDAGSVRPLFEVLSRFRTYGSNAQVLVIGTEADETFIECVIAAGARGFLDANAAVEEFSTAVANVREGSIWAPRKVLSRLIGKRYGDRGGRDDDAASALRLTPRESDVLGLLIGGQGNREIGASLGIDTGTVKAHLGRIMRKAGVVNRVELTMYALHWRAEHTYFRAPPPYRRR